MDECQPLPLFAARLHHFTAILESTATPVPIR